MIRDTGSIHLLNEIQLVPLPTTVRLYGALVYLNLLSNQCQIEHDGFYLLINTEYIATDVTKLRIGQLCGFIGELRSMPAYEINTNMTVNSSSDTLPITAAAASDKTNGSIILLAKILLRNTEMLDMNLLGKALTKRRNFLS